jgi:hypothetical protein
LVASKEQLQEVVEVVINEHKLVGVYPKVTGSSLSATHLSFRYLKNVRGCKIFHGYFFLGVKDDEVSRNE